MSSIRCAQAAPAVHFHATGLTSTGARKVEQGTVLHREESQQKLGLAIRYASRHPGVEMADVSLEGDAAQPAIQRQRVVLHDSAQDRPEGDGD